MTGITSEFLHTAHYYITIYTRKIISDYTLHTTTQTLYTTSYGKIQQKQKSYYVLYCEYTLLHTQINQFILLLVMCYVMQIFTMGKLV